MVKALLVLVFRVIVFPLVRTMKNPILILLAILLHAPHARADEALLPPKELCAEWKELEAKKFAGWKIKDFLGWDVPFDGGSKVFFFVSDGGERFDLMVANPAYWTAQDKAARRQVFMVIHKNRFYRIEPKGDEERNLVEKLTTAAAMLAFNSFQSMG